MMKLLVDVSSHTRTWANSGHTSAEIVSMSRSAAEVHKKKPGRNNPCPCGGGLKYQKCCGR
ncbi:MAG: SEC-C domain-containing protein [Clostridiales bacterium]|nr:SEC-C domain-containing protein [Clostridiales bacterium]